MTLRSYGSGNERLDNHACPIKISFCSVQELPSLIHPRQPARDRLSNAVAAYIQCSVQELPSLIHPRQPARDRLSNAVAAYIQVRKAKT